MPLIALCKARFAGKPDLYFSGEAERVLMKYYWPGNVRELHNILEQIALLSLTNMVTPNQLALCPGLAPDPGCDRAFHDNDFYCMPLPKQGVNFSDVERDIDQFDRGGYWGFTIIGAIFPRAVWHLIGNTPFGRLAYSAFYALCGAQQ